MVEHSTYEPSWLFRNCHIQTILPSVLRKVTPLPYVRKTVTTKDGDILFVDTVVKSTNKNAVIIIHGMEGHTDRPYMQGIGNILSENSIDIFAMNMRGCGGENRTKKLYNAGLIDDLDDVMAYVDNAYSYESLFIVGFSLGGNVVLNFIASEYLKKYPNCKAAGVVSVPINLAGCAEELNRWYNRIYRKIFLKDFYQKISNKEKQFPELLCDETFKKIETIQDYDTEFTAPLGGYRDCEDYYTSVSALKIISDIELPFMFMSSLDDPFLEINSFPIDQLKHKDNALFVLTEKGGHVGFYHSPWDTYYYHEERIADYFKSFL